MKKVKKIILAALLVTLSTVFCSALSYAGIWGDGGLTKEIETVKSAIEASPNDGALYLKLGNIYNEAKEYELAQRYLKKALELGVSEKDVVYGRGYAYMKLGYYDEAIKGFNSSLALKVNEGGAYYGLGYCYFKMKKYDQADDNLEKAIGADKNIEAKAKLYKGIIKFEQQNYDEAIGDLKLSLRNADDSDTRISARNYISAISKLKRKDRKFMLAASLSFLYDDNVVTASDSEAVQVSDKEDVGGVGYIRGAYFPIKTDENMLFVSYMFYQKLYQDLSEYDLQDHNALLNYTTMLGDFGALSLKYKYDYYTLDDKKYFQKNEIKPVLKINETQNAYLEISAGAANKDHFSQKELSGKNFTGGLKQAFQLRSGTKISFSYNYNKEDTKSNDFEFEGHGVRLSFNMPVFYGIDVGLDADYYNKKYNNIHTVFLEKRDDEVQTVYLKIKKELTDYFSLLLGYNYTSNESNIDFYEYTRNTAYLELKYLY
jgi:tetratricopeptide (TPR) repeat protein